MIPQWIIEKKRDGQALAEEELRFFVNGYVAGTIPDYQMSALAMAILWRDMTPDETAGLTRAMRDSGVILDTASITGPKIDKHSTGGIGDKISLVLAPLAAACGLIVPMISGRGLGITGGTLDKLESIPGYRVGLDEKELLHVLSSCGCCMVGQSDRIAPADRKLYALRDVTGTVPSIPLIVASILSKKLAAGLNGLVMDVKWGSGAFMKTIKDAEALAGQLMQVGTRLGLRMAALITNMNQPLGRTAGNALEVREALEILKGGGPADVAELTLELGARMLIVGQKASDRSAALDLLREKIRSGEAFERFQTMVRLHGGDVRALDRPELLPEAPIREPLPAERSGFIQSVDAGRIGKACLILGAGRTRVTDSIDHAVGVSALKKIGEPVEQGEPLAVLHAHDRESLAEARTLVRDAFGYSDTPVSPPRQP
ncbi:MAG: thymidine phosphorylase [Verrucomicrobia bacterium]|nr:thymidine phosphorylase [Verrucomicrobiota bacterium]MBU4246942.1 thymidine phosphorylase [Verrucomicrobiota bacterium]MBU4291350.1 thymidine phosphorylase [Verrucomicrobiota bacterium]MBU4498073.1 thymidine phosphorylase [Verrucomicrobiota bacterium]